jgi:flagellar motor protein MotB
MRDRIAISVVALLALAAILLAVFYRPQTDTNALSATTEELIALNKRVAAMAESLEKIDSQLAGLGEIKTQLQENKQYLTSLRVPIPALPERSVRDEGNGSGLRDTGVEEASPTCNALRSEFKEQIAKEEVTVSEQDGKLRVTFADGALYEFGRASLTPQGRRSLQRAGEILKKAEAEKIRIVGHTDNTPIAPKYRYLYQSNWELSADRAAAAARYLQKEIEMDPERMEIVGRSFHDPISTNETERGRRLNRRVEILATLRC